MSESQSPLHHVIEFLQDGIHAKNGNGPRPEVWHEVEQLLKKTGSYRVLLEKNTQQRNQIYEYEQALSELEDELQVAKSRQSDIYNHLPCGGWWLDRGKNAHLWWSDGDKSAWYSREGKFIDDSILKLSGDKLTRNQAISIIEQHKAICNLQNHQHLKGQPMLELGKAAYEGYCESSNNKSLVSGAELPKWDDLKVEIKEAWAAAAQAVIVAAG